LVRQAATGLEQNSTVQVSLQVNSQTIPSGNYPFALYQWHKLGVRSDESLTVITQDSELENSILDLIPGSANQELSLLLDEKDIADLETCHHAKWTEAQAEHIADNHALVEQRMQSLTISHRARCNLLDDAIEQATDSRILRMKESELERANQDFNRRLAELEQAAKSADIHATPIVFGALTVTRIP